MEEKKPFRIYLEDHDGSYRAIPNQTCSTIPSAYYNYDLDMVSMTFEPIVVPEDKIVLDPQQHSIFTRIQTFWDARLKYQHLHISHKRSILLYGPPGTGKTTIIRACVRDILSKNGIALSLRNLSELPIAISAIRSIESDYRPIIVTLEDIERRSSDLLEVLDGSSALDGVLFLSTTNYINKVDGRLKNRPSRIDEKILVSWPPRTTVSQYLAETFTTLDDTAINLLSSISDGLSMAHIKELALMTTVFGATEKQIRARARKFLNECKRNAKEYTSSEED